MRTQKNKFQKYICILEHRTALIFLVLHHYVVPSGTGKKYYTIMLCHQELANFQFRTGSVTDPA
jgi:hypothetical protein